MFLDHAYTKQSINESERLVLKLDPRLAPIKVAIFPLLRNKPELVALARQLSDKLRPHYQLEFDDHGNIGKRYRRQDEIGTPFTITVDFTSLTGKDVTVRDRDSMQQTRVSMGKLQSYLKQQLGF
jgi:glycyl-tRNA synthetase